MPQIEVSKFVKDKLDLMKREEGHKTYDSTVRILLFRAGYIDGRNAEVK